MTDKERYQSLINRVEKARNFPHNTTPASRYIAMIGQHLFEDGKSFSLDDDPQHCGESMLLTVADLWETKNKIHELKKFIRGLATFDCYDISTNDITEMATSYLMALGLDYDDDADSNNQAAG